MRRVTWRISGLGGSRHFSGGYGATVVQGEADNA